MIDNPLSLSKDGLTALSNEELAQKTTEALDQITAMKERGADVSVQEKVYEAYVNESNRRLDSDAPTKPHGMEPVKF